MHDQVLAHLRESMEGHAAREERMEAQSRINWIKERHAMLQAQKNGTPEGNGQAAAAPPLNRLQRAERLRAIMQALGADAKLEVVRNHAAEEGIEVTPAQYYTCRAKLGFVDPARSAALRRGAARAERPAPRPKPARTSVPPTGTPPTPDGDPGALVEDLAAVVKRIGGVSRTRRLLEAVALLGELRE